MMSSAICAANSCFSRYRYTGKERDTESGNDYFGLGTTQAQWAIHVARSVWACVLDCPMICTSEIVSVARKVS